MADPLPTEQRNPLAVNLEILGSLARFAFANGYRELGYDVVAETVAQVGKREIALRAILAATDTGALYENRALHLAAGEGLDIPGSRPDE